MNVNIYSIGAVCFKIRCLDEMKIKQEQPFKLFQSVDIPQVNYYFCKKIPQINDKMSLVYHDRKNRVYNTNEMSFRYLGDFWNDDDIKESKCCIVHSHKNHDRFYVYFDDAIGEMSERSVFNSLGLEQMLGYYKRIILHSSYIIYNESGIIFSAPSQVGKSTQARLWKEYVGNIEIVNGDRSVIGIDNGRVKAFGVPFCGSSNISLNISSYVECITILRQGPQNIIKELSATDAVKLLYSECSIPVWDHESVVGIMKTLWDIVGQIPVYLYYCTNDKSAVDELLGVIDGGKRNESIVGKQ